MCTVSFLPLENGFILTSNRDEQKSRQANFPKTKVDEINIQLNQVNTNKKICLEAFQGGKTVKVETSFDRELLYAIEHTIHHMAIIKMGILLHYPNITIPKNFGVAESTIQYKSSCAQ